MTLALPLLLLLSPLLLAFAVDDAKQIEIKSKCNRARKAESRKQSHYRHIGVKVPRPRATRLQSTPPPPRLDPQWDSHTTHTYHTHLSIGTQAGADIYSRLIFMVTIFAFNRKSMKFLCLRLGALYFIYVCAYFCMCWQNIFHSKYFVCVTTQHTHTHARTHTGPRHLHSSLIFHFHRVFLPSNLGNLAA